MKETEKKQQKVTPPFELRGMSTDYFFLLNGKKAQRELGVSFLQSNLPVKFHISTGTAGLLEFNILQTTIHVEIRALINEQEIKVCEIGTAFDFEIANLAKYANDKGALNVPKDILAALVNLSISTTRGILFEKLAGTYLRETIMPLMYPLPIKRQGSEVTEQPLKGFSNKKKT